MRGFARFLVSTFLLHLASVVLGSACSAEPLDKTESLAEIFNQHRVVGTFALFNSEENQLVLVNSDRATKRKIPASTFKIVNALLALELNVVKDEHEVIPWGGQPQPFKSWERDMSMRDAIKISSVPVFQEIARRIGLQNYKKWLGRLSYGNEEVGERVETFWLEGPLKTSAAEQVQFLGRLARKQLPVSIRSQAIVANIIRLERSGYRVLYGKTGRTSASKPQLGWFVGWVTNERGLFTFALNMDIVSEADVIKRKLIAKALLKELDIY